MLTEEDILLIERVRDNESGHPDAVALTEEEKQLFKQRMKNPKFKNHFKLSSHVDEVISDEESIDLIQKIETASRGYHKK